MAEVAKGIIDIEINTGSAASTLQALQSQINAFNLALNKANATQGKFSAEYTKKLQDAINKTGLFTAETIRLQTAAATLDKTLSKGKTSLGQYFSARFNKDGAIAAETMALASERARRLQTQFIATSSAANGFQDALAVRPLAAFSSQVAVAGQKAEIMSAMFKQGTTQLINFGKNVQWAGRQLMVGFTVPLTIFGAVAGKTFMELEKQAVAFKKVYGDIFTTPAELNQNLEAVKGLASEYTKYGIAVKDTIGLAAQAAAAGRKNADLTDAVSQATRLATLGQMDQNAALETTISLQSAFRLSGQDLADTINFLNMVENQTVVSLQDIAAAIPRVAPVIQGLGGDVKDLTVFLAAMQEGGVDAAEGANALKSGLASLINPTRQATEMLSGMGINLQSIIEANKGDLMATVRSFAEALQGLDQFSRQQALEQVFGKFQYAKLGALFDNISRKGSQAQQVIATMGYTTEQLGATADKELKTIEESFGVQLTGAIERFKLAIAPIGEIFVKIAIPLVNFATSIAEAFNGLSDGQKKFAAIGAVIIGVVVPAVTMLTGLFLNLVGTLAKMTQGITLFGMGFIKGGPLGAVKALTQSSKYLSLAEMDAAMAAQQLAGSNQALNATLVEQVGSSNAAAAAIGNLTKAYSAMIATQNAAAARFPEHFGVAGASGTRAKVSQVAMRGVQRRNSGGPIFMSNGTTVPGTGNTDTVPAMLTPGEFVVNKEATKNNLGLLHSINNSKNPQGLNAGGKARGMQYLMAGQLVKGMFDNIPGGFASLGSQVARGIATTVARTVTKKSSSSARLPTSFRNQIITKRKLERSRFGGARTPYVPDTRSGSGNKPAIGPAPGVRGYVPYNTKDDDVSRIIGPEFDRFGGESARQDLLLKLKQQPGQGSSDYVFGHAGTPEYYEHARRLGLKMPEGKRAYPRGTVSQLEGKLFNFSNTDIERDLILDVLPKTGAIIPRPANSPMSRGIGASKQLFDTPKWYHELELIEFLQKENVPTLKIREIAGRVASNKKKLISESDKITETRWGQIQQEAEDAALLYLNAGGQVPGMQYFAANNRQRVVQEAYKAASGIRRRVRPGRDQRFSQQAVLKDYVHDANFVRHSRDPEDMNTLLSMMKPLTQQTRATRGTVLGSTNNPELPYAQQKRIVAAIKEGRYEDLFGMRLNFRGPGSYTTRRETDFSPFIGDLSNPTLRAFSDGFMTLKDQKEEIAKLRKIMRSGKFKKLTPGTAEYARALGMTGLWSPARSWRPGPNPTIGSDWTVEQVLANKLRDYNNRKKGLKKAFPDKKIQQLLIDEMVGSGTLAIDVPKAFYKHPRLPYRGDHIENLVKKENEILLGNRTSQITGVATDLRTRLPSLITQSFNRGNIVPGTGNTDTVPAMLTPGEFVVNKEATKKNYDLLTAINNSQRLNKGGMAYRGSNEAPPRLMMNSGGAVQYLGVGGMIAGMAPMAAGLGASMLPMAMAPEMGMFGQIAASTVAFIAAQKSVQAVLMKFQKVSLKAVDSTGEVGEGFKKLFPQLSKLSPNILKFIGPLSGAGAAIALVGFGAYKLNKQINDASKAGGKLAAAMYGTADSTNAIAETFGRQTRAQQAMVAAAEKATGEQVSEESQQVSSQFMQSDAGKALLKDISFVESSGKDAATALRNQLSQAIIAGAITAEEARAIAIDIGTALENERLAVEVSGKISQLMGPNGEKLTAENILKIQAEITPSVDISQVRDDAKSAYDDLNQMQKIFSVFKGGSAGFENQYKLEEVLTVNNSALSAQLNTVEFLNAAFKEGTITLENYKKALDDSKNVTGNTLDANAQILGFENNQSLIANADVEAQQKQDSPFSWLWQESSALKAMEEQKAQVRTLLEESGAYSDEAINKIIKDFEGVGNTSWGKLLTGEWSPTDAQMVINFQTQGLTTEEIDELVFKLGVIESLPDITTVIDFKNPNPKAIEELYSTYEQLQSAAAKGPLTQEVLVQATGMDIFNGEIMSAINALPSSVSIPIIMSVAWDAETNKKLNAKEGTSAEQSATLQDALLKKLKTSFGDLTPKPGTTGGDKSGGNSEKSKLDDLKKMLMERFRLQEMLIDKEAEGFNKRIKQISREIQLQQRQVALEEKQIEVRQKALEELSKKEDEVNTVYDNRISALDRVSASNSRLASQEQSRISLASALASGDIAAAASAMSDITQQSAESQIEDTKTALETQRETALKNLTVDVNGTLMTRKGIEEGIEAIQIRIDAIQTSIYDKNLAIQGLEDELLKTEEKRLKVAEDREKVETRLYLMEQKKAIEGLTAQSKKKKGLTTAEKQELAEYKLSYNNMVALYNQQNPSTPIQLLNRGGQVSGTGMTDTVPAMLTPGEFVIRKGAAKTFLPLLESINSGVFPSIGGMNLGSPRYDVPVSNVTNVPVSQSITNSSNASTMYNNSYSINVNVSGSNSSADEIANVVMGKIARSNSGSIRGSRY